MGLRGSGAADQHEIALVIEEISTCQIADQRLVDLRSFEVELFEFFGKRHLGDGHLVFNRSGLLLPDLGDQQVPNDLLGFMLAFDSGGQYLIIGRRHAVELQLTHCFHHV